MNHSLKDLKGFTLGTSDGEMGKVRDTYFDDEHWAVRYLVVDTGGWLSGRTVLITPLAIRMMEWSNRKIDVALTRQQVRESPDVDTALPVSRQYEIAYLDHYGYPYYWQGPYLWGAMPYPAVRMAAADVAAHGVTERAVRAHELGDPHLRSSNEMTGYRIEALDGDIGHIEDFLFDDETWSIEFVAVDTRKFWPGQQVLIEPARIDRVSWSGHEAHVNMTRQALRESPPSSGAATGRP